jgi:outer membrane cobalamin receptor
MLNLQYAAIMFGLLFLVFAKEIFANQPKENDTNSKKNTFILPEIEITKIKQSNNSQIKYSPNTIIDKSIIETINPTQLSDILIFSPGVSITNYGGLESSKTISIRGTGSMRTLVLLDGIPLNSSQNSAFDLSSINPNSLENIEIIRSGNSAFYGSSAIGGVVNLKTNYSPTEIIKAKINYASFNEIETNFTGNYLIDNSLLSASVGYITSDGNYPFEYVEFGETKKFHRENADFKNNTISILAKTSNKK